MGLLEDFSSGLFIIQSVIFLIVLFVLHKFAWKPIMDAVNEREVTIVDSLNQAKLAKEEVQNLKAENEMIIREAKMERDNILKEAREIKERIVTEAKDIAKTEGDKMIEQARQSIQAEKAAAMSDIKNQIGALSLNIAESILQDKLSTDGAHNALVENYLNKSNLN
ncbi:F0F1 ATP synthase subunit B [Marnyiella aurantia]|uniref:ATP synthase subunit b n=1 Tax=Marnyiella aurantia TaxID=2758037 RepID=A0A7D7QW87_9FLAO|nr:F0F1 ATP synthase subunit B [Marnyiella aurantia]MBA5245996.1 F0F1 ATP synthase subunit B [Marnyiella aurantia]MBP0611685.1 F0F1 ATP synthase subunit B [Marnyiella aurantia]QMS98610.1 F0F1 ATP synthase subunit B [Marnyiella aurantia]